MRYVMTYALQKKAEATSWWQNLTEDVENGALVFDTFEAAKVAMRQKITELMGKIENSPIADGHFQPIRTYLEDIDDDDKEYTDGLALLDEIIFKTVTMPDYEYKDDPDFEDDDWGDCYFAFSGDANEIRVIYYGQNLFLNVCNMEDASKKYFFTYEECSEQEYLCGDLVNGVTVQLFPAEEA